MSMLPKSPLARITLAIALSVVIHLLLIFTPMIKLPPADVPLPPLQAKLEPLPKLAPPAPTQKKTAPKPKPVAPVAPTLPLITPASEVAAASAVTPVPEAAASEVIPAPVIDSAKTEDAQLAHPLPKTAQLTFDVYKGTDFRVGEARLRLDIAEDRSYVLNVSANTTGIVSVFKKFDLIQTSTGILAEHGLRPNLYSEIRLTGDGQETRSVAFDWPEKTLNFSSGGSASLPDGSQDILSFMFQFSQLVWHSNVVMNISNGKKLERYEIALGKEQTLDTRMGKLRAIPFSKVHAPGEEGLDIWLAVEYRLLPVKISKINRDGQVDSELVISDIRVADQ